MVLPDSGVSETFYRGLYLREYFLCKIWNARFAAERAIRFFFWGKPTLVQFYYFIFKYNLIIS